MAESQTEPIVEQEQAPDPKMSPEEFSKKLEAGEIDTSSNDPEALIEQMVAMESEQETPETPLGEEVKTEEPKPEEPKAEKPAPEPAPQYKNFGELMADATEALGEKLPSARDLVTKAKNQKEQLQNLQTALEKWKCDATNNSLEVEKLKSQIADLKEATKKVATPAQAPAPHVDDKEPDFESEIPEVERPGEFADADDVAKYMDKVLKRKDIIADKKMKWYKTQNEKAQREYQSKIEEANRSAQEKVGLEVQARREQEAAEKARRDTIAAASDFVTKHKEFGISDVSDANTKYVNWLNQVEYVKRQNPAYLQRNLASDYFNGSTDAVQLLTSYGVTPPDGAKELALVIELQDIAYRHNMRDSSGRLNFDEAYILKKARDGVDIEENNDRVAKQVEKTLDIVQQRQSAPQSLGASEAAAPAENVKVTPEQVSERIAQLQDRMSTMRPDEREKAMKEVEDLMSNGLGVDPFNMGA